MTVWLIVTAVLAVAVIALIVANETRVQRRRRALRRIPSSLTHTMRRRSVDVIELCWDEPDHRVRLGRLNQ